MTSLPLILRVASRFNKKGQLSVGQTEEVKNWRLHRYSNSLHMEDTTNAGKRGKVVLTYVIYAKPGYDDMIGTISASILIRAQKGLSAEQMKKETEELLEAYEDHFTLYTREEKGVRVLPAGFSPIVIRTDSFYLDISLQDFTLKNLKDEDNETTCIPNSTGSQKDLPVFYRWVKDNAKDIKHMSYREMTKAMDSLGVNYRSYCARD